MIWIGVVESRKDPLKINRVQVRIVGQHNSNKQTMPTNELPWAFCITPANDPSSIHIKEGDFVVGTYLDGQDAQQPIVFGTIAGIPDQLFAATDGFSDPRTGSDLSSAPRVPKSITVSAGGVKISEDQPTRYPNRLNEATTPRLARNENIEQSQIQVKKDAVAKSIPIAKGKTYDEPPTPYAAAYPYNRVLETESGHVIELDDTPGAERVHIYHRSGSSDEYHPDGTKVSRVHNDGIEIILADKLIYVSGDCSITSKKSINLKAAEDLNIEAGGMLNIKADGPINLQGIGIQTFSAGPFAITGVPLLLNSPGVQPPLGTLPGPISLSAASSTTNLSLPAPVPTEPGNVALAQRSGANLGDKKPNEAAPQSPTPQGIPVPVVANTTPVPTITTTEGADVMIRALNRAKITDATQRAMIYAQANHESNGFKTLFESFKYTDQGLIKTWPSRFNANNVAQYVRQYEKIANRAYGGRMGNGDEASGDGWKYRGRGFIMLTGKENYIAASQAFNQDFVNFPDAVAVPDTAADLAIWYFQKGKKTGYRGSYSDIVAVTKFVNGGTNGLDDRQKKFDLAKANTIVVTFSSGIV